METSISTLGPNVDNEPIPHYVLKQRLGCGGYGEVWEAEAPGGLRKAVKFVYGMLDEARAQRELKSLNRIKEVHHPFLLSIERIEIVEGRLIIVTELAQGCVKNRFDECRNAGLEGIPREELLGYLHDAADALDFIHERHGLQHLDIKPENLLLVGNHVKVADFGLLKDLSESMSMVGGITPLYSPPEAFDGRPNRHSDQYSLAIVYQELLTGEPPFGGRTAAQLAAQHLHSPPMLAVLPPSDQPVIARALSKKPDQRFPSCRALIDALSDSDAATSKTPRRKPRTGSAARTAADPGVSRTEPLVRGISNVGGDGQVSHSTVPIPPAELRDLPPIELPAGAVAYRPTILVGVGGTAGFVLSNLQRRLHERFGDPAAIPAVQMLLVDTDPKDLATTLYKRGHGSLPARSTLAIPLRAAKDYRSDAKHLLEWLSRRWLYNIPRSLQTEGLRPLGRLAFVDHSRALLDNLKRVIEGATSDAALEESRHTTGLDFRSEPPNVFVIASLAGGTGSGVVLDLAYAVRKALGELGLPDQRVHGLLLHSTSRKAACRDLAVPSTLACLQELRHFSRSQGCYPGDPDCDLPAYYGNNATFHHTYLIHLGNELSESEFGAATDRLAEYLYQNVLTPGASFFEQARQGNGTSEQENSLAAGRLRTIGIAIIDKPSIEPLPTDEKAAPDPIAGPPAEGAAMQRAPKPALADAGAPGGEREPNPPADRVNVSRETDVKVEETQPFIGGSLSLAEGWRHSAPQLDLCGGARRTLVLTPPGVGRRCSTEADRSPADPPMTFVEHDRREIVVCQEVEDVPLENVVALLLGQRRDYLELADRLHTRIDVDWTPLRD